MPVLPLTLDAALAVAGNLRPDDEREVSFTHPDIKEWAASMMLGNDPRSAWYMDGKPVAMGGVVRAEGVGWPWFVASPGFEQLGHEIHYEAIDLHRRSGMNRFFVSSWDGHSSGKSWLKRMGYRWQTKYHKGGGLFHLYELEGLPCVRR